jgi:hypothetical protein
MNGSSKTLNRWYESEHFQIELTDIDAYKDTNDL